MSIFSNKQKDAPERSRLPLDEWKAKKNEERNSVYELIDKAAAETVSDTQKLTDYLKVQSRMDRYSVSNALLIYAQYPEAVKLRDFDGWAEKNISIQKGAKSISILEAVEYAKEDGTPGTAYNVKRMFDISQTNADGKSYPEKAPGDPKAVAAAMLDSCEVKFKTVDTLGQPDMNAFYDSIGKTLYIKRGTGSSELICQAIAEELAHAEFAMNAEKEGKQYDRNDSGFQAACAAFMLCEKFGINTDNLRPKLRSIPSALRNAEPKEVRKELAVSREAMRNIYTRTNRLIFRQKQEQNKSREQGR